MSTFPLLISDSRMKCCLSRRYVPCLLSISDKIIFAWVSSLKSVGTCRSLAENKTISHDYINTAFHICLITFILQEIIFHVYKLGISIPSENYYTFIYYTTSSFSGNSIFMSIIRERTLKPALALRGSFFFLVAFA